MGQWLTVPMILGGLYLMATAKKRRVRVEPIAGQRERCLTRRLADALRARASQRDGPISVEDYMAAANAHYYATRDPLGAAGDFITAPEISQMFGELVGAALADVWTRAGAPADAVYAELGPGRGTLADDALRVMRRAGFAGEVHLVETSPALREAQAQAAARRRCSTTRIDDLAARAAAAGRQ